MILFILAALLSPVHAEKIELHRKALTAMYDDLEKYEKRMGELRVLKNETQEGPTLEAIVNEIADLQKKLLDLKHRKNLLSDHLRQIHPMDNLLTEMALKRESSQAANDKGTVKDSKLRLSGGEDKLDNRLNGLLKQIQSQYMRTAKDREELAQQAAASNGDAVVIDVDAKDKKREILQEDKDKYLKDAIKTKMKVN